MSQRTYIYIQDPSHGWIGVPTAELLELGISQSISTYSYQAAGVVWLEEDCDAAVWFEAYKKHHGKPPTVLNQHVNATMIRNMPSYRPSLN